MISEAKTFEEYKGAGVFADLLLDRTFKKAFNPDTQNKVCLIALLNAVLEGEIASPIVDVQSRNKETCTVLILLSVGSSSKCRFFFRKT